jgi:hypothetical protein
MARGLFVGSLALSGCVWTTFDELKDDVWVDSSGAPSGLGSSLFGESVIGVPNASGGATVVVLSRNAPTVSTIDFGADGAKTQNVTPVSFSAQTLINTLDIYPPLAADAESIAVGGVTGSESDPVGNRNTKIAIYNGQNTAVPPETYEAGGTQNPLFGNFVVRGIAFGPAGQVYVARDNGILSFTRGPTPNYVGCRIDPGTYGFGYAITVGDPPDDATDNPEVIVASAPAGGTGIVWTLNTASLTANNDMCGAIATREVGSIQMQVGTQLAVADVAGDGTAHRVIVSSPGDTAGRVTIMTWPAAGTPAIEAMVNVADLNAMAIGDLTGDARPEIAVGSSRAEVEGASDAGTVRLFTPNGATIDEVDGSMLTYPSPKANQRFGKSVAIVPFGTSGENVLVVSSAGVDGKDNSSQVLTYFRTSFYPEVRAGRQ